MPTQFATISPVRDRPGCSAQWCGKTLLPLLQSHTTLDAKTMKAMVTSKAFIVVAGAAVGVAVGLASYTFIYAKGASYMTDNPAACANCHVMQEQYDAWLKSSHRSVAVCNDCHTPAGFIPKYLTKAENGYHHSLAFTSGNFHEPIQIKARNRAVTENACRKCHSEIVTQIEGAHKEVKEMSCIRCHETVGHMK